MALPYASAHVLYTFHGGLPGGENWSIGLRTIGATPAPDTLQAIANYAAEVFAVKAWNARLSICVAPGTTFVGCTVRAVNIQGVTTGLAEAAPVTAASSLSTTVVPDQIALVVTLITPIAGRHGKGRVYLPFTGAHIDANGRVVDQHVLAAASALVDLVDFLNGFVADAALTVARPSTLFRIGVQSRTSGQPAGPVTGIKVGNVADTIRGRRQKLAEVYTQRSPRTDIDGTTVQG